MKIYIVDDDPTSRLLASIPLRAQSHQISEFESAAALLEAMDGTPDLILMDIEMPGTNGIELCRALREAGHDRPHVVFVSVHDDLDSRLAAYNAGGSDYIVKPFYADELLKKIHVAEQTLSMREDCQRQAQYAQTTAFTAMSSMGEMGVVLEFLRNSFSCVDTGQVIGKLIEALRQYGLNGLIQTRASHGRQCHSSTGLCTSLDESILDHAAGMGRIFSFHDRIAINYPNLTLIAAGLPVDDPDRLGRLRDDLAILAEGADARIHAMEADRQRRLQSAGMTEVAADLGQALTVIEKKQATIRLRAEELNLAYLAELDRVFVHLGLTDSQERVLTDLAQQHQTQLDGLHDDDRSLSDRLHAITDRLRGLAR